MSLKIAVIGAGDITLPHLETLKSFQDVKVVGIANRSGKGLEELKQRFSINETFTDWRAMLAKTQPDAVFILVSSDQIYSVALECLTAGIPCFIEKPAGISLAETAGLTESAQKSGCINMVGLNRRFYSSINSAMDFINFNCGGLTGLMVEDHQPIDELKRKGKHSQKILDNWLFANGVHTIDLLRYIAGEPEDLNVLKTSVTEKNGDGFSVHGMFGQKIVTYVSHWHSGLPQRMVLYGRSGSVVLGKNYLQGEFMKNGSVTKVELSETDRKFKPGFYLQCSSFLNSVVERTQNKCDLNEYLKTAKMIDQIQRSQLEKLETY